MTNRNSAINHNVNQGGKNHFDSAIYQYLGFISGHSLKHLFAAIGAAFFLLPLYRVKNRA